MPNVARRDRFLESFGDVCKGLGDDVLPQCGAPKLLNQPRKP